jgi:hypothetical protein
MPGMSGGFGGGDTTTSTQQMRLPEWYQKAAKGTLGFAKDVASRPYQPYGGQTVAGINPYQQQAFDWTKGNLGVAQGDIRGFMQGMNGLTNFSPEQVQAGQFAGTNMSPYMNPYTQNVVDTSLNSIDRARQMELQRGAGAAAGAGAFGGSRHGVADALTNEAALRQSAETSANLYNQGYQQATGLAMQDIGNRFQGDLANQQAGIQGAQMRYQAGMGGGQLAQMANQAGIQSAAALQGAGDAMQNQTQAQLADRYKRFLEQRGYPQQQLDIMLRSLGGMGLGNAGTTNTSTTGPPGNPWLQGLGAASSLAGIFGSLL